MHNNKQDPLNKNIEHNGYLAIHRLSWAYGDLRLGENQRGESEF